MPSGDSAPSGGRLRRLGVPSHYRARLVALYRGWAAPACVCAALVGCEALGASILRSVATRLSPTLAWLQLGCWGGALGSTLATCALEPGYYRPPPLTADEAAPCTCGSSGSASQLPYLEALACRAPSEACETCGGVPHALWCFHCRHRKPAGAHHCHRCQRCVEGFDHHCDMLNTCIGRRNYGSFLALLGSTVGAASLGCVCTAAYVLDGMRNASLTLALSIGGRRRTGLRVYLSLALAGMARCAQLGCRTEDEPRTCPCDEILGETRAGPEETGREGAAGPSHAHRASPPHGTSRVIVREWLCGCADWIVLVRTLRPAFAMSSELAARTWGAAALVGGATGAALSTIHAVRLPPGFVLSPLLPLQLGLSLALSLVVVGAGVPFARFHAMNVWLGSSTLRRWRERRIDEAKAGE